LKDAYYIFTVSGREREEKRGGVALVLPLLLLLLFLLFSPPLLALTPTSKSFHLQRKRMKGEGKENRLGQCVFHPGESPHPAAL
jgi:hypothetical protein